MFVRPSHLVSNSQMPHSLTQEDQISSDSEERMWLSILVSGRRCLPLTTAKVEPASFVCSSLTAEMTDIEISSPINLWYVTESKRTGENDERRVVGH